MNSRLNKEYKKGFSELRCLINTWELIPDTPEDAFDSINHLFLSQLYKGSDNFKISKAIRFELINNYGFSIEHIDCNKMTTEVIEWWNNFKK